MGRLFGDVSNLKVGIASKEHVVHITVGNNQNTNIIYSGKYEKDARDDANSISMNQADENVSPLVSQEEVYRNKANENTARFFMSTAGQLDEQYDAYADADKDFKKVLESIRDYLIANSRSSQQKAAKKMQKSISEYIDKADKKLIKERDAENSSLYEKLNIARDYQHTFDTRLKGNLELDETTLELQNSIDAKDVEEPSFSGFSGAISRWTSSADKMLFPHEPSPTDIKQGIGINDCYMLSCLIKMADTNPEKIKNAMRDNNDGTVTVRFYDTVKNPETDEEERKPVYIRVKKTESSMVGTGAASYASGSLWVQMMEKAYAKYNDMKEIQRGHSPKGLAGISLGNAYNFMNAFEENPVYKNDFFNNATYPGISIGPDGKVNHAESEIANLYCNNMYDFLAENKDEMIVVGAEHSSKAENKQVKALGVRTGHAYPILKVFEADGEKYVQLRDPYATFEAKYNENGELTDDTSVNQIVSRSFKAGSEKMGVINLKMRDFAAIFTNFSGISESKHAEYKEKVTGPCDAIIEEQRKIREAKEQKIKEPKADIVINRPNIDAGNLQNEYEEVDELDELLEEKKTKVEHKDEFSKINYAMANFAREIKSVKSKYHNSWVFDDFEDAVKELSTYNPDNINDKSKKKVYKDKLKATCDYSSDKK